MHSACVSGMRVHQKQDKIMIIICQSDTFICIVLLARFGENAKRAHSFWCVAERTNVRVRTM
jgi:hypothetical protein